MKQIRILWSIFLICLLILVGCGQKKTENVDLSDILAKIREAYGENYLPSTAIEEETVTSLFGLDMDLVEEFVGEMPMISFHPDQVLLVKAAEGKGEEVETQLKEVRRQLVEESFQYPANMPKVESSQVVRNGDYVAFLLVGAPNENTDASEEEQLKFAQEETRKAVDAFNSFF